MIRVIVLHICIFCFLACAPFAHAEGKKEKITIVVFGDDLVSGRGVSIRDAFPAQLEEWLRRYGYNVKVVNKGVDGQTSIDGYRRISQVTKYNPDMVIIIFGINDMLRGIKQQDSSEALENIITAIKNTGSKVLLAGIKKYPDIPQTKITKFNHMFARLASGYKTEYSPSFLKGVIGEDGFMLSDKTHPNEMGIHKIVVNITPYVFREFGWEVKK